MKHQSYIRSLFVAFCAFFVCVSAVAGELNPFAFKLSSSLSGDVFNVNYYLNAPATSVKVTITLPNDQKVVYDCTDSLNTSRTSKVKGIYKLKISLREYINNNPDFRGKTDLPWSVDVMGGNSAEYPAVGAGQRLAAEEVTSQSYNFYSPWSVDIDIDPHSDNFGTIYMVERIDGDANLIKEKVNGVEENKDMTSYYGWQTKNDKGETVNKYKGGLYSFDPAFQNYPTMYSQTTDGGGTAYDFVNYDVSKVKAIRRDASMNANDNGHKGGAFTKNDLFGRVRIAYKPDHNNRVFLSFSPEQETSGSTSILLGEIKADNYPLIGRNGEGTDWFAPIMSANKYEDGKLGYYSGDKFVAGPNIVFDVNVHNSNVYLMMLSGRYKKYETTSRGSYRCDEYAIGIDNYTPTITKPHKAMVMNMYKNTNPNETNLWYFNGRKLVTSCTNHASYDHDHCWGTKEVGFSNTYSHRGLEYDPDGMGFWHVQVRDHHNELPSLVHFRFNAKTTWWEVNFAEYVCGRGGAAVRYDINSDRLAVAGGNFSYKSYNYASSTTHAHLTKNVWKNTVSDATGFSKPSVDPNWITIYDVNKSNLSLDMIDNKTDSTLSTYKQTSDIQKTSLLTDSVIVNLGCRAYDFAWDYADNLYICATGSHKFFALALPHAGKTVSTPCKTDYYYDTPTQTLEVTITPNRSCGNVVDYACPQMTQHWIGNSKPNTFAYYYLSDDADVKTDPNNEIKVQFQLEATAAEGYRFYTWDDVMQDKALKSVTTVQYVSTYAKTNNDEKGRTAHFGIDVWETKSITQTDETMTFKGVFVQRELDDVSYSTICLPFNLTTLEGTPYAGASVLKFDKAEDSDVAGDNRTFLTFKEVTFTNGDIMEAGKPYLIKLETAIASGVEKIFKNVTCPPIGTQGQSVTHNGVTFHGMLNPTTFTKDQVKDKLFLTADNRLVSLYGQDSFTINGLRGYFTVNGGAQNVEYMLNLPEKVVTSTPMVNMADSLQVTKYLWDGKIYIQRGNELYDLSGARVK